MNIFRHSKGITFFRHFSFTHVRIATSIDHIKYYISIVFPIEQTYGQNGFALSSRNQLCLSLSTGCVVAASIRTRKKHLICWSELISICIMHGHAHDLPQLVDLIYLILAHHYV